jgi:hypothetical protein
VPASDVKTTDAQNAMAASAITTRRRPDRHSTHSPIAPNASVTQ